MSTSVCFRCKSRKKKCDKTLPCCSRCTRLHVRCQYQSQDPAPYINPVECSNGHQGYPDGNRHFTYHFATCYSSIGTQTECAMLPWEQNLNIDQQFTHQVFAITSSDADDLYVSCSRYFVTIHEGYDIIVKEDFYRTLASLRSSPMADFSILVLAVYFVSKMHRQPARSSDDLKQLYHTAKSMHSLLAAAGRASVELVQAGLLLGLYEHSQALHNASFQTIGGCARMGYTLGLHKTLSPKIFPRPEDNKENNSQRLVWWGIIALERISMLEQLDENLPFAIPTPLSTDLLPSPDGAREPISLGLCPDDEVLSQLTSTRLTAQARMAQSVFLLSSVIEYVMAPDSSSSSHGAACLDRTLRSFMMALLQEDIKYHQGPYTICLSALLTLNRYQLSIEPRHKEDDPGSFYKSRAALGVQSVLRMVLEGTQQCSALSHAHMNSAPVWGLHRIFKASLLYVELGDMHEENEVLIMNLDVSKAILRSMEPRWKIAGKYLKAIEEAELCQTRSV